MNEWKIKDIYKKDGVEGFFVDLYKEGTETIKRFHFSDDRLINDKFLEDIELALIDYTPKTTQAVNIEEVKLKYKDKEIKKREYMNSSVSLSEDSPMYKKIQKLSKEEIDLYLKGMNPENEKEYKKLLEKFKNMEE
ncbi:MAG: hypothetical protein QXL51_01035 [Candidatus Aenigmatarchaeota archaeon]